MGKSIYRAAHADGEGVRYTFRDGYVTERIEYVDPLNTEEKEWDDATPVSYEVALDARPHFVAAPVRANATVLPGQDKKLSRWEPTFYSVTMTRAARRLRRDGRATMRLAR